MFAPNESHFVDLLLHGIRVDGQKARLLFDDAALATSNQGHYLHSDDTSEDLNMDIVVVEEFAAPDATIFPKGSRLCFQIDFQQRGENALRRVL